jgi:hypothetical protein
LVSTFHPFTTLTQGIWERIQVALQSLHPDPLHTSPRHRSVTIYRPGPNYFDGLFANLNRACSGNCVKKRSIEGTGSPRCCGDLTVLFAASDWSGNSYWHPSNVSSMWFKVDFKNRKVSVMAYAIHKCLTRCGEKEILKTWAVEGSNSGSHSDSDWTVIDARSDDESLQVVANAQALFACNGDTAQAFRYIRLIQRGPCHNTNSRDFVISQFEVFGVLSAGDAATPEQ